MARPKPEVEVELKCIQLPQPLHHRLRVLSLAWGVPIHGVVTRLLQSVDVENAGLDMLGSLKS